MKSTEQLKKEHQAIKMMLKIMTEIARLLETGQGADLKDLNDILEFLRIFADRCHHGKEEELLFPALESAGVPRDRGPLGVMLSEHQSGRALIKDMDETLSAMARREERAGLNFARQARAFVELLTAHIDKEDNVLYPLAEARFNQKIQKKLTQGFEKIENEMVGPGRHQEFHRLLERLEEKYLKKTETG
ncbi:MAG: hemerythrin domain-containing protein [Candidatus Saccharicenans sp.]|uniref:hemerythrin domain-containing protein n=1 Tax=Candidatus Saccharicenans sp. TaxID=2819258 RepID=UPI00404B5772